MADFYLEFRRGTGKGVPALARKDYRDDPRTNAGNGWIRYSEGYWAKTLGSGTLEEALQAVRERWPQPAYTWRGYPK